MNKYILCPFWNSLKILVEIKTRIGTTDHLCKAREGSSFQRKLIRELRSFKPISNSNIFSSDTFIGKKGDETKRDVFVSMHDLEPIELFEEENGAQRYSAVAITKINAPWHKIHDAKEASYTSKEEGYTIVGFCLKNVTLIKYKDTEGYSTAQIISRINLGEELRIEISDLSAYENSSHLKNISSGHYDHLMNLCRKDAKVMESGILYAPEVNLPHEVKNHLTGMRFVGDTPGKIYTSSEKTLFKMDKNGIIVKAETRASIKHSSGDGNIDQPTLYIDNGFVIEIYHENQLLFIGYAPKEHFRKRRS